MSYFAPAMLRRWLRRRPRLLFILALCFTSRVFLLRLGHGENALQHAELLGSRSFCLSPHLRQLVCSHPAVEEDSLHRALLTLNPLTVDASFFSAKLGLRRNVTLFVALLLKDNADTLPTLIGELLKVAFVLQRQPGDLSNVFLSIYESGSIDNTTHLLDDLLKDLRSLGFPHSIVTGGATRKPGENRIRYLARLRNLALLPLIESKQLWDHVLVVNDIFVCASSLLELLAQHETQLAHQTCALDYFFKNFDTTEIPWMYDIWAGVDIAGNHFELNQPYFVHKITWEAFLHMEPFQVFTCWGGAVLFQGSIFQEDRLRFRSGGPLECATSECDIITRDMWSLGYNRIMTVPTSPTAYTEANHNAVYKYLNESHGLDRARNRAKNLRDRIKFGGAPELNPCRVLDSPHENEVDHFSSLYTNWLWWYKQFGTPRALRSADLQPKMPTDAEARLVSLERMQRVFRIIAPCTMQVAKRKIPRVVHFIRPGNIALVDMPFMNLAAIMSWMHYNPCYDFRFFSEVDVEDLLDKKFPTLASKYRQLPRNGGQKADLMKYAWLHEYGGVYADTDAYALDGIDELFSAEDEFVAGLDIFFEHFEDAIKAGFHSSRLVASHVFAAAPQCPVLMSALELSLRNLEDSSLLYHDLRSTESGQALELETIVGTGMGALSAALFASPPLAFKLLSTWEFDGVGLDRHRDHQQDRNETERKVFIRHHRLRSWLPSASSLSEPEELPNNVANI